MSYEQKKTLSPRNQACINCPIFQVEVPLRSCFALHEKFMRGERPDVRRGCQAMMSSNKCPIWHIHQDMRRTGDDPYHSVEKKTVQLKPSLIERIAPVIISERDLERFAVPDGEAQRIMKCETRPSRTVSDSGFTGSKPEPRKRKRAESPAPEQNATVTAAQRGDMSAAVNKAMENA